MEDIYELISKAQAGDKKATEEIVENNIGLIWSVVKKFTNRGHDADDLFQIGAIGLIKCIKKFNLEYDVKFSTYAVPMIIGEIKRFLRDDGMIKISRPLKELHVKVKYLHDTMLKETGEEPKISEMAKRLNVNIEELLLSMEACKDIESLYSVVYQGDGNSIYLIDKISSQGSEEDVIIENLTLNEILDKLKPKEREIIKLRYFQDKTQTEVAYEVGVSQVQISRIEKKVLETMRRHIKV